MAGRTSWTRVLQEAMPAHWQMIKQMPKVPESSELEGMYLIRWEVLTFSPPWTLESAPMNVVITTMIYVITTMIYVTPSWLFLGKSIYQVFWKAPNTPRCLPKYVSYEKKNLFCARKQVTMVIQYINKKKEIPSENQLLCKSPPQAYVSPGCSRPLTNSLPKIHL